MKTVYSDFQWSAGDPACQLDRCMSFEEIAEMAARCEPAYRKTRSAFTTPLTFVVPNHQVVASLSRFIE